MASEPDLSPLELQREGNHLRFCLAAAEQILPELPADYEQLLSVQLRDFLRGTAPMTAEVDLQNIAGISSRELGSLIALQKVLRPRFGRVPIRGVSDGVRHLLAMTHVDQLFQMA